MHVDACFAGRMVRDCLPSLVLGADLAFAVNVDFAMLLFLAGGFLDSILTCSFASAGGQQGFGIVPAGHEMGVICPCKT